MSGKINAAAGILVLVLFFGQSGASLSQNIFRGGLVRSWMRIKPALPRSDVLHDDIPDGWAVQTWGGATAIYTIATDQVFAGQNAFAIQRTNLAGGVALAQDVTVPISSQLSLSVYAKGVGGAIQILGSGDTLGWLNIPAADTWQNYRLTFQVSSAANKIRLLLRAGDLGNIYFDEAYLGIASGGREGANLLVNSGFEKDGYAGDPLTWWISEVAAPIKQYHVQRGMAYKNIEDMLTGNRTAIQQRARELGSNCAETPAMTGWLLARGDEFEKVGGVFAREQLYKLAIELAPNCPQPYAALAGLYQAHYAYEAAVNYYQFAAEKTYGAPLTGLYYFSEGLIQLRNMGDLKNAIISFENAERYQGWEPGIWYNGAAAFFLGRALEQDGRIPEAIKAYQRVIDCSICSVQSIDAKTRLSSLKTPN